MKDLTEVDFHRKKFEYITSPKTSFKERRAKSDGFTNTMTAIVALMEKYEKEACVKHNNLVWALYIAANPTAIIIPSDPNTKDAIAAAYRAMDIHAEHLKHQEDSK